MNSHPRPTKRFQMFSILLIALCMGPGEMGCRPDPDRDSKAYLDRVVPVVFKDWDPTLILREADPRLKEYVGNNPELFLSHLQIMKETVGAMKTYRGCVEGQAEIPNKENLLVKGYVVDADFEKGNNKIVLETALSGGKWHLSFFVLDPDANRKFLQPTPTPTFALGYSQGPAGGGP